MVMKKSPGPSKPADLLRKPAASTSKKASGRKSAGESAAKAPASDADTGECTCGAEVGKQLEAMETGGLPRDKAEKDYRKD